ncbi:MAG: permease [Dehalococcoidia bacterium]
MREFLTIFFALMFETTPFLLLGVVLSALAGPWLASAMTRHAFRQPAIGIAAGSAAGLLLPTCDCGSRPLAHRLTQAGARDFGIAMLVAAPVVNPIVIVTTWLAFRDADIVILRLAGTVLIAVAAAIVVGRLRGPVALAGAAHSHGERLRDAPARALDEFFELFPYLVVGSGLAALLQTQIDRGVLTDTHGLVLSTLALMALAFLLSICSSVDAFVVAGLGPQLGLGPTLAFLVFGPIVNLKSMPLYGRLFSAVTIALITGIAAQVSFGLAMIAELRAW